MQLGLAVATACEPSRCRVNIVGQHREIDAAYGARVLNRIKVRPGDLVALDLAADPPEVVWRWWHGTVRSVSPDGVLIERRVTMHEPRDAETATLLARLSDALRDRVGVGDVVYFVGHRGEDTAIVGVAGAAGPEDPMKLGDALLPGVAAAYEAMSR